MSCVFVRMHQPKRFSESISETSTTKKNLLEMLGLSITIHGYSCSHANRRSGKKEKGWWQYHNWAVRIWQMRLGINKAFKSLPTTSSLEGTSHQQNPNQFHSFSYKSLKDLKWLQCLPFKQQGRSFLGLHGEIRWDVPGFNLFHFRIWRRRFQFHDSNSVEKMNSLQLYFLK